MIRNRYGMRKTAGDITDSAAFLGTLAALGVALPSVGLGWVLGKTTAPRRTAKNLFKYFFVSCITKKVHSFHYFLTRTVNHF